MAAANENPDIVRSFKLKGHRQGVLCLASDNSNNNTSTSAMIWSGSDDATCRLFDLRARTTTTDQLVKGRNNHAVLGILAGGPVLSIAPNLEHNQVYVAAGDTVKLYDIRHPIQPLIRNDTGRMIIQARDEINQILLCHGHNSRNHNNMMLVAGDDAGYIYTAANVTSSSSSSSSVDDYPPCGHDDVEPPTFVVHDELAMVTSIVVVCSTADDPDDPPIVISGGTDCSIIAWRNGERISSIHIPNTSTNVNQICNPPMVHTMALLACGGDGDKTDDEDDQYYCRILAGFGDYSLGIVSLSKTTKQLELTSRIENVPADAVATMTATTMSADQQRANTNNRRSRIVGSAGGGTVAVWQHESSTASSSGPTSSLLLQQRYAIPHGPKVNAICWGDVNNSTLFVADTTNDITCYKIPL